ncbi:hypothetical protein PanWU01x14_111680 [Parasponia andersonii]|uniref:Uncharacterized protein n=1 Tax=Parasponia andersonii TaxID=3476 RepID=A0A2P5CYM1_PARAD|nr:hypothetical protein PanWU01x14_111680 [Parasponia andersonii]
MAGEIIERSTIVSPSPQRVRAPFQRAEQYELHQNEPENRRNQEPRMQAREQVKVVRIFFPKVEFSENPDRKSKARGK